MLFEVESHEYDAENNIDYFVFNPGNMAVTMRIVEDENGEPQVYTAVTGYAEQVKVAEANAANKWALCKNKVFADLALAEYAKRK